MKSKTNRIVHQSFLPLFLLLSFCIIISCNKKPDKAQLIVNECIEAHGGKAFESLNISFDFRDKHYNLKNTKGDFLYERIGKDSVGNEIKDIFTNTKLERFIAGKKVAIADSMASKYKNSINSVAYFTLLPKPLNDDAVNKSYIGESQIGGQNYHKIKVTFNSENGGKDHDDVYVYWINQAAKTMDYFAYSYKVDGGGVRFREVIKSENIGGIRFQNYINYAPIDSSYSLENMDQAFTEGKLQEFSRIENLNLKEIN
jgi:hypothetical protein